MEEEEPEFRFSKSGIAVLVFLFIFSIFFVFLGHVFEVYAIILWGYVILMSSILALLVVLSRLFAYKASVESIKRIEEQKMIEQRIKRIMMKKKEEKSGDANIEYGT